MSNIVSLCEYRARKIEEQIEAEWTAANGMGDFVSDEELKSLMDYLRDALDDDYKPCMWANDFSSAVDTITYTVALEDETDITLSWDNKDEPKS